MKTGPSVLVVDDEVGIRDFLSHFLQREGFRVTVVNDGREALTLLTRQAFDVVFLDACMPHLTGAETLLRLRRLRPRQSVIWMSGYPMGPGYPGSTGEEGDPAALPRLTKPFGCDEILALLRQVLTEQPAPVRPPTAGDPVDPVSD